MKAVAAKVVMPTITIIEAMPATRVLTNVEPFVFTTDTT